MGSKSSRSSISAAKRYEKEKKERQKKLKKSKKPKVIGHFPVQKLSQNFDFCTCPKRNASGKKGMLSHCECLLEKIGANLAHIQPENLQKALGVNGLSTLLRLLMVVAFTVG